MKYKFITIALFLAILVTFMTFFSSLMFPHFMPIVMTLLMLTAMVATIILQCQYQLRSGKLHTSEQVSESPIEPKKPVILIIGPSAATWFSKSNNTQNSRHAGSATWLQVGTPEEFEKRLTYLNQSASNTPVHVFFPFLPDDNETIELTLKKLRGWYATFRISLNLQQIPCTFAIYMRLSSERRSHSVDNATWDGELSIMPSTSVSFYQALDDLDFNNRRITKNNCNYSQRRITTLTLLHWIKVSGISDVLSDIFSGSSLKLDKILLCDYGNGFTRHGAWSKWLEKKYAILPSLGTSITLPPLPSIRLPIKTPSIIVRKKTQTILPKLYWSICLITLLLAAHMLSNARYAYQYNMTFRQQLKRHSLMDNLSIQKLENRISYLENEYQRESRKASYLALRHWGFVPYHNNSKRLLTLLTKLKSVSLLSTAGPQEVFSSGSATLLTTAAKQLNIILNLVRKYPHNDLLIIGHSDDTGNSDYNLLLSKKRAISVRNWLLKKHIDPKRLRISAAGDTEPVANNGTPQGRQHNRRIEILIFPR